MKERYQTSSDADLLIAIRTSDAEAFEALYYRYYGEIKGFIRRKFGLDEEAARDLLQEVFARIWEKRGTLDPEKSIRAFLYQIARNRCIDQLRKSGREVNLSLAEYEALVADVPDDLQMLVQQAVNQLPAPLREVVVMKWIEGRKYKEIGQILGISPRTVEQRMGKAMKILLQKLKDALIFLAFSSIINL